MKIEFGRSVAEVFACDAAPGQDGGERGRDGAVDGIAVDVHPIADVFESLDQRFRDRAIWLRTYVEQIVSAFGDDVHQMPDECGRTLEIEIMGFVSPGVVDSHAGFPVATRQSVGRDILFRSREITARVRDLCDQAVVQDDVGLMSPHHVHEFGGPQCLSLFVAVAIVPPQDVDGAVARHQFLDLVVHEIDIFRQVPLRPEIGGIVAHWVNRITLHRELRVMPVEDRKIQSRLEPRRAKRGEVFRHDIPSCRAAHHVVRGMLAVKKAESLVMFGSEHRVFHACPVRQGGPGCGVVVCRGEAGG